MLAMATSIGRTFRNEPRRRFTNEYKRQVVRALLASPMSLSRVAREHDLNHNQLARWRLEYEQGKYGTAADEVTEFDPVCVEPLVSGKLPEVPAAEEATRRAVVTVELHLPKGKAVIRDVSLDCLRDVIEALR